MHTRWLAVLAAAVAALALAPPAPALAARDATPARIAGAGREETAARVARATFDVRPETSTALLARSDGWPDALAAASLAGAVDGPVLLTRRGGLDGAARGALEALGIDRVVLLGGEAALTAQVERDLGSRYVVERVAGRDRYGTAAAVARTVAEAGGIGRHGDQSLVILASGATFADALAGGPLAYAGRHPILLTTRTALPPATAAVLDELRPQRALVLGGTAAISEAVVRSVRDRGIAVERIAGAERTATAAILAGALTSRFGFAPANVVVTRGDDFPDALAGAPRAGAQRGPILLAPSPRALGEPTAAWISDRCGQVRAVQAVGGQAALRHEVLDEALRRARVCAPGPVTFGYAAAAGPTTGVDQEQFAEVVRSTLGDRRGWAGAGAIAFAASDEPELVLELAAASRVAAAAPVCTADRHCRVGDRLYVNADLWLRPPPAWAGDPDGYRRYAVNHLAGRWLGMVAAPGCPEAGRPAPVMLVQSGDLGGCARSAWPGHAERAVVQHRYLPTVTVAAAGDVHGEGPVRSQLQSGLNPLRHVTPVLSAADLAVVNLETAVGSSGRPADKTFTFQAPPALVSALAGAGVDVVNLANNHALDYGVEAMFETIRLARQAGLAVVGAGANAAEAYAPAVLEVRGRRVAFVGLSRVLSPGWAAGPSRPGLASAYDEAAAVAAVRHAAAVADHVVVAIHWGVELATCPDGNQLRLARLLTEAGADVVAGHHPHVLQGIQQRDRAVVAYSLGNFVWYHNREPSRYTGVVTATLGSAGATAAFTPAEINTAGSPLPASGALAERIHGDVARRSPGGGACGF